MPQSRRSDLPLPKPRSDSWASDGVLEPICSGQEFRHLHLSLPHCYHMLWMLPCKHPFLSPMTIATKSRLSSPLLASSFTPIQSILSFNPWPMFVKRGFHYITVLLTDLKSISRAYKIQSQFRSPIILPNPLNRTTHPPSPSTTARAAFSDRKSVV